MRKNAAWFAILCFAAQLCWAAAPGTIEHVDEVAIKAGGLDGLLNNQPLLDEYFKALQDYYGEDRIPKKSFLAVAQKLKLLSSRIPDLKTRLWETHALGKSFSGPMVEFKPVPRRLHGIWKSIPLGECVDGNCDSWGTVALKDSHLHMVERNGRYVGFVEVIPGKIDGKIYGSVSFGGAELKSTALFLVWFENAHPTKPDGWIGYVVSEPPPTIRNSPNYVFGKELLGEGKTFTHIDPLAEKIVKLSFTRVKLLVESSYFNNIENIIELLTTSDSLSKREILDYFSKTTLDPKLIPTLKPLAFDSDFEVSKSAFQFVYNADPQIITQDALFLAQLFKSGRNHLKQTVLELLSKTDAEIPDDVFAAVIGGIDGLPASERRLVTNVILKWDPKLQRINARGKILEVIKQEIRNPTHIGEGDQQISPTLYDLYTGVETPKGTVGSMLKELKKEFPLLKSTDTFKGKDTPNYLELRDYMFSHPEELNSSWIRILHWASGFVAMPKGDVLNLTDLMVQTLESANTDETELRAMDALISLKQTFNEARILKTIDGRLTKRANFSKPYLETLNFMNLPFFPEAFRSLLLSSDPVERRFSALQLAHMYPNKSSIADYTKITDALSSGKFELVFESFAKLPEKSFKRDVVLRVLSHANLDKSVSVSLFKRLESTNDSARQNAAIILKNAPRILSQNLDFWIDAAENTKNLDAKTQLFGILKTDRMVSQRRPSTAPAKRH